MGSKILTDEEIAEFQEAVKNVKPLRNKSVVLPEKTVSARKIFQKNYQEEEPELPLSDAISENVKGNDELFFAQSGIQHKTLRDLRTGKISQTGILDLHGMTVVQARSAIIRFLKHCQKHNCRCVRIIHGKGLLRGGQQPILKNHVNSWLQQHPEVLAFCTAKASDGGTGAVYVLLKKEKKK